MASIDLGSIEFKINRFRGYCENLKTKIEAIKNSNLVSKLNENISNDVKRLFEQNANFSLNAPEISKIIENEIANFSKLAENAWVEALSHDSCLRIELRTFEECYGEYHKLKEKTSNEGNQNAHNSSLNDEFDGDEALMINESINEFSAENELSQESQTLANKLNDISAHIENLTCKDLKIDEILRQLSNNEFANRTIQKISFLYQNIMEEAGAVAAVACDPAQIKLATQLSDNFSFKVNEQAYIQFVAPTLPDSESFYKNLEREIWDTNHNQIEIDVKEKITSDKRIVRLYFTPNLAGIHNLVVKYSGHNVSGTPASFVVLPNGLLKKSDSSSSNMSTIVGVQQAPSTTNKVNNGLNTKINNYGNSEGGKSLLGRPQPPPSTQRLESTSSVFSNGSSSIENFSDSSVSTLSNNSNNKTSVFTKGRGRLLRNIQQHQQLNVHPSLTHRLGPTTSSSSTSSVISPTPLLGQFQSQKRKSPTLLTNNNVDMYNNQANFEDQDENMMMDTDDSNMNLNNDASRFNKKAVLVNETINTYHDYSLNSLSSYASSTLTNNNNNNTIDFHSSKHMFNIISNHLKKYASNLGIARQFEPTKIPNLKAQFQRKFDNLQFPIGVRACRARNWLIVCESGKNAVRVYERSTGEMLYTLSGEQSGNEYSFCRPSACLIYYYDNRNSELFIKDDNEIFVFDMENDFKLLRRFGNKLLQRPYGLAFDSNQNLVLIDANIKKPLIFTFDKKTGKVLNSRPFEPVLEQCAKSQTLVQLFDYKNVLGKNLAQFERTKCRFIYSNQNSLFVSDLGRSIVYKTNMNGEIELAFGQYGKKPGELNEPSGIHVESDGSAILVGDSKNDRLNVYNSEGVYQCGIELIGDRIVRPSDIYVDSDGFLYISCFIQRCVKKYKFIID